MEDVHKGLLALYALAVCAPPDGFQNLGAVIGARSEMQSCFGCSDTPVSIAGIKRPGTLCHRQSMYISGCIDPAIMRRPDGVKEIMIL